MSSDDCERQPPSAQQVAQRALCLCAVTCRGYLDNGSGDPHAGALPGRMRGWLAHNQLLDCLEPWEAELISVDLGELPRQRVYQATWAAEGLAVLGWALGRCDFPAHDRQVDPYAVTDALAFLAEDTRQFIETAELRGEEELQACRELKYAIHCRLREYLRNKTSRDISSWLEQEWLDLLRVDRGCILVEADLGIGGQPISATAEDVAQKCEWSVCRQHRASIWLIGEESPSYWDWPVDT